jgi:hypothetical protein
LFLNLSAGRILSANPDGSDLKAIVNEGRKLPDGLALDVVAGHIYWTNMGDPTRNDGSIMRSDLDGKNMQTWTAALRDRLCGIDVCDRLRSIPPPLVRTRLRRQLLHFLRQRLFSCFSRGAPRVLTAIRSICHWERANAAPRS